MSYCKEQVVDVFDTDLSGVVRASSYLKYMQTAATAQLRSAHPNDDDLRDNGMAFILSTIEVDILRPVKAWETVQNESWGCPGKGFTFPRAYHIFDADGDILWGMSQWALVNFREKKLVRYSDEFYGFIPEAAPDMHISRLRLPPRDEMAFAGKYQVRYAVTDITQHMNNTYYPDMFTSFLDMRGKWVSHMTIRFLKEAPFGETLSIYLAKQSDDTYLFLSLLGSGEINAEASFTLSNLA